MIVVTKETKETKETETKKKERVKNNRYDVVANVKDAIDNFFNANQDKYDLLNEMYEEMGEYCGVSPSTIAQMKLKNLAPSYIVAIKLAEFMNVKPTDIWAIVEVEDYESKKEKQKKCKVLGCTNVATTKGYCMKHVYYANKK